MYDQHANPYADMDPPDECPECGREGACATDCPRYEGREDLGILHSELFAALNAAGIVTAHDEQKSLYVAFHGQRILCWNVITGCAVNVRVYNEETPSVQTAADSVDKALGLLIRGGISKKQFAVRAW